MKKKLTITEDEQEFHVNYYPIEMGSDCEVYTTIPWAMKYLERMVNKYPDLCKVICDDNYSYTVRMPFKLVKPRAPRFMSDEQKQKAADQFAKMREEKLKQAE